MNLKDTIFLWMLESDVGEWLYKRKHAISTIEKYHIQLASNLVKYLYYDSPEETKKQLESEINAMIYILDDIYLKKHKYLSYGIYYEILYNRPLGEDFDIEGKVRSIDRRDDIEVYDKIGTIQELHVKCQKIMHAMSMDASRGDLNNIAHYAKQVE